MLLPIYGGIEMHPDTAFQEFNSLMEKYKTPKLSCLNEADTRAKIIDFIIKECLGWTEENIKRETHVNDGYIDYELIINGVRVLTLEAKKTGEYFEIPTNKVNRNYKISGIVSTIPNLLKAMKQVQAYCSDTGCKYAVVSNGYQFVIFTALTVGSPWREGSCLVFNSFEDIRDNFNIFWKVLSHDSVREGGLVDWLDLSKIRRDFKKVISEIHNPDQSWARNDLYIFVQPLCDFIFSELLDEARTEVLKECYVHDKSTKPLTDEIEKYFVDKLPHFSQKYKISQIEEDVTGAGQFEKDFKKKIFDKNGSLMVLLGGIGSGKSTFIHRFFKVIIAEKENHLWFYIDFRNASLNPDQVEEYILEKMYEVWCAKYKDKLSKLLSEISFQCDDSDRMIFFSKLFGLAQYLPISTTVIIDNIDQHEVGFQEKIFLTAHHLKDALKTVVILALREETFLISTRTGVLDAYYIPKFHISAPNFLKMILKRIDFAIKTIKYHIDGSLPKKELTLFFTIIKASLYRENTQSKKIVEFINNVSTGNMREALRMFNSFIVSGNTNVQEMFNKHEESGSYQLSYHQLIKSIMLGEYRHYSQERSHIMNVYDFDYSITDSPFHLLRILRYLLISANKKSPIGRGYLSIDELIIKFETLAIPRKVVFDSFSRLVAFNLIEFDNQTKKNIKSASFVKLTASGKYYLETLTSEFTYLDLVLVDTPISDISFVEHIRKDIQSLEFDARLKRAREFIHYLKETEIEENKVHPEYSFHDLTNTYFMSAVEDKFNKFCAQMGR
jgi:predicted type IV restriction endonuclease